MIIIINARFLTQEITGVQRFAFEVSRELKKIYGLSVKFIAPKNILYPKLVKELEVEVIGNLTGHLWEQISLPIYLYKIGKPLLINLTNTAPILYRHKLTTFCDVSPLSNPEWYSKSFALLYNALMPLLQKTSIKLLTISEFSKQEIIKYTNAQRNNIEILYCALPSNFKPHLTFLPKEKFFLCVSSINPRKNFERVVEAFINLALVEYKLIIVGGNRSNFANSNLILNGESNKNIIFAGRISDDELIKLYQKATGFIYASLYEGFGIPPLEAQSCGCPVLVSDIPVHREILQESVIYCNPYDVESISKGMSLLISQPNDSLINLGFENAQRFSWEISAKKLAEIINNL